MTKFNWKLALPIFALIVVIGVIAFLTYKYLPNRNKPTPKKRASTERALPKPSGKFDGKDGAINAFLLEASSEQASLANEETSPAIDDADARALRDFTQSSSDGSEFSATAFCTKLGDGQAFKASVAADNKTLNDRRSQTDESIKKQRKLRDDALTKLRKRWDENRAAQYKALEANNKNAKATAPMQLFEQTVTDAVTERRTSFDKARSLYTTGLSRGVETRRGQINAFVAKYVISANGSADRAKAECVDPKADQARVLGTFKSTLKGAHDQLRKDYQSLAKARTPLKSLIDTRRRTLQTALDNFRSSVRTARNDFKQATK